MPPFQRGPLLKFAAAVERLGGRLSLPGAGVTLVEATKQVYRPVGARRARRALPNFQPALSPAPTGVASTISRDV